MAAQTLPLNAYETTEAIVLVAPMPAVQPEDVHVTVEAGTVRISADCRTEAPKDYLLHEWHYGPFERSFELPNDFGFAGGDASLGNGQLAVRILRGEREGDADDGATIEVVGRP
jgi:HSP20 family molecular chaperone IbpA